MKKIVIFFPTQQAVKRAYEGLSESIEKREMQMFSRFPQKKIAIFIVRNIKNFLGGNIFSPDFQLVGDTWEIYEGKQIAGDLVIGFKMPENVTHKYPSNMREICIDKSILETLFPKFTLQSIICNSYQDIVNNFNKISSDKKVLKPISESGGRGIEISNTIPDEDIFLPERFPYLLQEFHDTSGGFYDICRSTHDFRIVILDGEIIGKILREPKYGSLVCNTGSGGTLTDIWNFKIPENIMDIITKIDNYCSRYTHRYYSIDMGIGRNGEIKVYELNSASALSNEYIAHKLGDYIVKNILKIS